jgi:hypothetical protein
MHLRFATFSAQSTAILLATFLVACAPKSSNPSAEHINLVQSGQSESGLYFVLENDTSSQVVFRGWGADGKARMPSYSGSCYGDTSSGRSTNVFVGAFRDHTAPERIKVEPGAHIQLIVANEDFQQFKGEHCRINLTFEGGLTIESTAFVP